MSRDTQTDFLLQDLVFLINLKKSVLKPSQQMEFSVLKMDSYGINKIDRSDALSSTVLPACLQLSYLQKQRIKSLIRLVYARQIQQTDALISDLAAFWNVCPLVKNMQKRREFAHKCSEYIAAKFAILTFKKGQSNIPIQLQIDKKTVISYLLKIGDIHNRELLHIKKFTLDYLLNKQIAPSAKDLPSALIVHPD